MKLEFTERFIADYDDLPKRLQHHVDKTLGFLLHNPRHPSLRTKKMRGVRDPVGRDLWEARVTRSYRILFAIVGDTYLLYRVGPHRIVEQ